MIISPSKEWDWIKSTTNSLPRPTSRLSAKEISRREMLLLAQVELGKAQEEMQAGDEKMAKFHFELYQKCKAFVERKPKQRSRKKK
jgi:hypothetical protein